MWHGNDLDLDRPIFLLDGMARNEKPQRQHGINLNFDSPGSRLVDAYYEETAPMWRENAPNFEWPTLPSERLSPWKVVGMWRGRSPFLNYACTHLLQHADKAAGSISPESLLSAFCPEDWAEIHNVLTHKEHPIEEGSLLYILAVENHSNLIRHICRDGPVVGQKRGKYRYPLFAAVAESNHDAVCSLLGFDVQVELSRNGRLDLIDQLHH